MSCEVFCCEIPEILQVLVHGEGGGLMKQLFKFLELEAPIDNHLAGYFEKVLEMLFRHMTVPVMQYINERGPELLKKFLKHMSNYSIMQLVQRLMLPHIPFTMPDDGIDSIPQEDKCNWSFSEETCTMLCSVMLESDDIDTPSHISDLFVTVLQLSPADALILTHMSSKSSLDLLLKAAIIDDGDISSANDMPTAKESVSFAALTVYDAVVSRVCETANALRESDEEYQDEIEIMEQIKEGIDRICDSIIPFLGTISTQLEKYVSNNPCGTVAGQAKYSYPRLGNRGLQMVKLVEALVRLGNPVLDEKLSETGILKAIVDMVFVFDMNSMLHLSVQRIVLMIVEGGARRTKIQTHLLVDCQFLKKTMDQLWSCRNNNPENAIVIGEGTLIVKSSSPCLGHLLNMSQAINHILHHETEAAGFDEEGEFNEGGTSAKKPNGTGDDATSTSNGENTNAADKAVAEIEKPEGAVEEGANSVPSTQVTPGDVDSDDLDAQKQPIQCVMKNAGLDNQWEIFSEEILRPLDWTAQAEDESEYDQSDALQQQMELAMQALRLQTSDNSENTSWGNSGGDQQSQFHLEEDNRDNNADNDRKIEIIEDEDSDEEAEYPPSNNYNAAAESSNMDFTADFADFEAEAAKPEETDSTKAQAEGETETPTVTETEVEDDFADFSAALDTENISASAVEENNSMSSNEEDKKKQAAATIIENKGDDIFAESDIADLGNSDEKELNNE